MPSSIEDIQTISQSTSTTVVAGSAVSCNGGTPNFFHTDNSYYRGMTLSAFPVLTMPQFVVQQITVGVEVANAAGTGTTQPAIIRVFNATANPIGGAADPPGNNLLATESINISDQTLSLLPTTLTTQPLMLVATDIVAVEFFTPNGQTAGHEFFIGANGLGQAATSYLKAAPCGVTTITPTASIGFPNMHIVMQVTGNNQTPVELQGFDIE